VGDNIYDKIQEMFGLGGNNLNILEEQIDVDLQMEYYEYSKNQHKEVDEKEIIEKKDTIFEKNISLEDKKNLLVRLASIENIEAYRTIEKYLKRPNRKLHDWAKLAYQESRMLLESKLLDENQILISTGLGGKGLKLRYFVVFYTKNGQLFTNLQRKILKSELEYAFRRCYSEMEALEFEDNLASILCIIPLNVSIQDLFLKVLHECNQFGNFIDENYIITNVKCFSFPEIREFLVQMENGEDFELE
jgi:hypothetical protein